LIAKPAGQAIWCRQHTPIGVAARVEGSRLTTTLVAALCLKCHYEIDQGKELSKEERQEKWHHAHIATVAKLFNQGDWPVDVPIPTFTIDVQLSHSQGH
jgi:hypothetical protein